MDDETYQRLLSEDLGSDIPLSEQLDSLAILVDGASVRRDKVGATRAGQLAMRLRASKLFPDESESSSLLHYFQANAEAIFKPVPSPASSDAWTWHCEAMESEIRHLRLAQRNSGFSTLAESRQSQILTNLGNAFDTIGRFVDAIEYFDKAIALSPFHAMALGNRGISRFHYHLTLPHLYHSPGYCTTTAFLRSAGDDLACALELPLETDDFQRFATYYRAVNDVLPRSDGVTGFEPTVPYAPIRI